MLILIYMRWKFSFLKNPNFWSLTAAFFNIWIFLTDFFFIFSIFIWTAQGWNYFVQILYKLSILNYLIISYSKNNLGLIKCHCNLKLCQLKYVALTLSYAVSFLKCNIKNIFSSVIMFSDIAFMKSLMVTVY